MNSKLIDPYLSSVGFYDEMSIPAGMEELIGYVSDDDDDDGLPVMKTRNLSQLQIDDEELLFLRQLISDSNNNEDCLQRSGENINFPRRNNTNEKNCLLSSPEEVPRLASEWNTQDTDLTIITSKPKNPDYKVQGTVVATKRGRPVNFKLERVKPDIQVSITLTYQGHIYGDAPVKRCKKHDECDWCKEHEFNQGFCVISKFHTYDLDHKGRPVAILKPSHEHLDDAGNAEFSVVFACWNSCDPHLRYGKEMMLHIHILQDGCVVNNFEWSIQCCENLNRDAFKSRKRKLSATTENSTERGGVRKVKREASEHNVSEDDIGIPLDSSCPASLPSTTRPYMVLLDDVTYPIIKGILGMRGLQPQLLDDPPPAATFSGN